ncbi:MAG: hypothetical protein PHD06_09835 [Bacteroidales bacterium]|nr:hypothetical protein [Bacteroidales bacterium]MDY0196433.1 hypothetical protein [Tenuifilaceae bacterium]
MKKLAVCTLGALMLFVFSPIQLNAATEATPVATNSAIAIQATESKELVQRLEEIKDSNKSDLSFSQKKELRKEVRTIKSELKQRGDGIYISAGAAIIIIILLIILL